MPPRYQRPYPPEFRREAVSLVRASGRSIPQVAGELQLQGDTGRSSSRARKGPWAWSNTLHE